MGLDSLLKKWQLRHAEAEGLGEVPQVLLANLALIPRQGLALDLACGRGAGALALARHGLEVSAWDFSPVAIDRLMREAMAQGLGVHASVRDVVAQPPEAASFDLVLVGHFLERGIMPHILAAVRPGGVLLYQTWCCEQLQGMGPANPDWRLRTNELLTWCHGWSILHYHEQDGMAALVALNQSPLTGA